MFIGKSVGAFQAVYTIWEVMLDHVTRSITSALITPMFSTTLEIIICFITFCATVSMLVISIADLNNPYVRFHSLNYRFMKKECKPEDINSTR